MENYKIKKIINEDGMGNKTLEYASNAIEELNKFLEEHGYIVKWTYKVFKIQSSTEKDEEEKIIKEFYYEDIKYATLKLFKNENEVFKTYLEYPDNPSRHFISGIEDVPDIVFVIGCHLMKIIKFVYNEIKEQFTSDEYVYGVSISESYGKKCELHKLYKNKHQAIFETMIEFNQLFLKDEDGLKYSTCIALANNCPKDLLKTIKIEKLTKVDKKSNDKKQESESEVDYNNIASILMGFSDNSYYVWKKQNRRIIRLLSDYFTQDELLEYLSYGKIERFEFIKDFSKNDLINLIEMRRKNSSLKKLKKMKKSLNKEIKELKKLTKEL